MTSKDSQSPGYYSLQFIADQFDLDLLPAPSATTFDPNNIMINGIAPIDRAQAGMICFVDNPKYQKFLADTKASAVVLAKQLQPLCQTNMLLSTNPYLAYAKIAELFAPRLSMPSGVHPSAIIAADADIDPTASIGPNVVIESGVTIGPNVLVQANTSIGAGATIGAHSVLWPNVVVYHGVSIGEHCELFSGAVIGSDGFGNAQTAEGHWYKVPQLGAVRLGNHVSIGSNTTIDRGSTMDTVIADGAKLDNQIQIAHNVQIGAHTAIAGCVAIAGSTVIGNHCQIGGGAGLAGHITVADYVGIAGMSIITKSITTPGHYIGRGFGVETVSSWLKFAAKIRNKLK